MLNIPLMSDNIEKEDIDVLIRFLQTSNRYTNGPKVKEFEKAWTDWLGDMPYATFVNSGSSANFITFQAIREICGDGEVILSPMGWSSDVSAVLASGLKPVFVDVDKRTMGLDIRAAVSKISENTKAVLLTHVLGHNGLTQELVDVCHEKNVLLVEDVCESHGAMFQGRKCGSIGDISNFSFYYAHHMSTIEGGMICTKHKEFERVFRMYRSHGMLREAGDEEYKTEMAKKYPDLHPEFIFMVPGYNMRSTELNAVIGLNQLKRLDKNIQKRQENYRLFLKNLDSEKYFTDFLEEGSSNYAFVILLRNADKDLYKRVTEKLAEENVEFRRGTAGGGNLLRQPFVRKRLPQIRASEYPNAEFIHEFGIYTGNYPALSEEKILGLCQMLNLL